MAGEVQIEGLAKFRRALKQIDPQLQKDWRNEILPLAKSIAEGAASRVPVDEGDARASIRAGVSGNNAYIVGGKGTVEYFGWLDFGSRNPISGRPREVGPWKKSGEGPKRGRFIYVEIDERRAEIQSVAARAADTIIEKVLP